MDCSLTLILPLSAYIDSPRVLSPGLTSTMLRVSCWTKSKVFIMTTLLSYVCVYSCKDPLRVHLFSLSGTLSRIVTNGSCPPLLPLDVSPNLFRLSTPYTLDSCPPILYILYFNLSLPPMFITSQDSGNMNKYVNSFSHSTLLWMKSPQWVRRHTLSYLLSSGLITYVS